MKQREIDAILAYIGSHRRIEHPDGPGSGTPYWRLGELQIEKLRDLLKSMLEPDEETP